MGYTRKKVSGNTTATFNTKTGQTRYTTSNKVGNITNSTSHKGNSTRSTKTTTVNGVITRTSKSSTPPKMKAPKPPKVQPAKKYKYTPTTDDSDSEASYSAAKWVVVFFVVTFLLGLINSMS